MIEKILQIIDFLMTLVAVWAPYGIALGIVVMLYCVYKIFTTPAED